ncbi:MAG TPA: translocation/assembly module TamB domain-containing protein, partial [Gemmatimonadales bacterium]|nr:translocation/assembly module TamB domain-containing protein [Gemmatimonadales bacterium]
MSATHRWFRRFGIAATGVLVAVVAVLALLQLPPVATWLVRRLSGFVPLNPGHRLEVGRVSGDWLHGLVLEDVGLVRGQEHLLDADRVRVGYDVRRLRGSSPHLDELIVEGARVTARRGPHGWDLANALRRSADTTRSGAFGVDRIALRDVQVTAWLAPDSAVRVRSLTLLGRELALARETLLTIDDFSAAVAPPRSDRYFAVSTRGALAPGELRFNPIRIQTERTDVVGRAVLPRRFDVPDQVNRLDVRLDARPIALADLAAIAPVVRPAGELRFESEARGREGKRITATLAGRLDDATLMLEGSTTLERGRPAGYRLNADVRRLDPSALLASAPAGDIEGTLRADVRGTALTASEGRIELRLDRSLIGGTTLTSADLDADLDQGRADLELRADLPNGELRARGWARPFDSLPSYRLAGTVRRLPGTEALVRALAGAEGDPVLDLRFGLRGSGVALQAARVSGRVDLVAVWDSGTASLGYSDVSLVNGRLEARPELLVAGGRVRAVAVARVGERSSVDVRRGTIESVDLGKLMGDTIPRLLDGEFTARYRDGLARASLTTRVGGGEMTMDAEMRPLDSTRGFTVRQAALDSVDLGGLLGQPALSGPVSLTAQAHGRWNARQQIVEATAELAPSRLGTVELAAGTLRADVTGRRLSYEAGLRMANDGGTLHLAGDGEATAETPSFTVRAGRADSLDVGAVLGQPGLRTALNARFTGHLTGGTSDGLRAELELGLLSSRINEARVDSGRVALKIEGGAVEGDMHVGGADGALNGRVEGRIDNRRADLTGQGNARLEHLARWTGQASADGRLESEFKLHVLRDSTGLNGVDGVVTAAGAIGDMRLDPLHLVLALDTGAVRVDTLIVRSNVGALDGAGRVPLADRAPADTLRVRGRVIDSAPLASLIGPDTVWVDSATVDFALTGPARARTAAATADVHRLFLAGNLAEHVTVKAAASVDRFRPSGVRGEVAVEGGAYGKIRIPEARIAARYDSLVSLVATATLDDSLKVATRLRGTARADTVRAALERLDIGAWSLARTATLAYGSAIEIRGFELREGARRLTIDGRLDRKGKSDLTVQLDSVDLDVLNDLGLAPVPGLVDGTIRLAGTAEAPSLSGKLGLVVRERGGVQQVGRLGTELTWTTAGLSINAVAAANEGGFLTVSGTVPIRFGLTPADTIDIDRGTAEAVNLRALSDSFGLALLNPLLPPETAKDLKGRLEVDARIGGSLDAPSAEGAFALDSAGVTLPTIAVTYSGGTARGKLGGDLISIDQARVLTGKNESVTARGTVRLKPLDDPALDLTADLASFRVANNKELRSLASGSVRLGGTVAKPSLSGKVRLGQTDLFVGTQAAAIQVEEVELTPADMRQLTRYFGPAVIREAKDAPGLVERFQLDLSVEMPRRVWVRRRKTPKMDIELSGTVQIRQQPMQPMEFFGQVEPVPGRASIEISGREFNITGGEVRLDGPIEATRLDVEAEFQAPTTGDADDEGVVITVNAVGHPDSLGLKFSSDPSMGQEDIVSYIVTGRPASDNPLASRDAGGANLGEQVAFGALAEAVSTRA